MGLLGFQMRNAIIPIRSSWNAAPFFSSVSYPKSLPAPVSSTTGAVADIAGDDDDLDIIEMPPVTVSRLTNFLQPRVLVYDGVCHLCHTGVKWIFKVDKYKKIKFCCLQSKAAEPYLEVCGVEREDVLHRFVFIEGLGQYHRGSTAAPKVVSYLPFPYSALSALLMVPIPLRDAVYDYTAKRRHDWFGKGDGCLVLKEPHLLERFIDREEILEKLRSDS